MCIFRCWVIVSIRWESRSPRPVVTVSLPFAARTSWLVWKTPPLRVRFGRSEHVADAVVGVATKSVPP